MKYFLNVILFLFIAIILGVLIAGAAGINRVEGISEFIVTSLPFGTYLWKGYCAFLDTKNISEAGSAVLSIGDHVMTVFKEFAKLTVTWLLYRLAMRNGVDLLMKASGHERKGFLNRLEFEFLYNMGFILAALISGTAVIYAVGMLSGVGGAVISAILQVLAYGLITAAVIFFTAIKLSKAVIAKTIFHTALDGTTRLLVVSSFFMLIHYINTYRTISTGLLIFIAAALAVNIVISFFKIG